MFALTEYDSFGRNKFLGIRVFPTMSRFDKYRPRYELAPIIALIAAFSIAELLIFEIEKPRLTHRPELPTIGTEIAAEQAGARVTPSNPAETKAIDPRQQPR